MRKKRGLKVWIFIFLNVFYHDTFSVSQLVEHQPDVKLENSLAHFIHEVFRQNPRIRAAESNLYSERAREVASGKPLYNPHLVGQAQQANESQAYLGFSQAIDWTNKRAAKHAIGIANVFVARAQLRLQKLTLAAEVMDALSAYTIQTKLVKLAEKRVDLLKKFLKLTHERFKKGDIPRIDVDLAQLSLSQSITQLATVEINKSMALQKLRETTGLSLKRWPLISEQLKPLKIDEEKIKQLTCHYPMVLMLRHVFQSARAKIQLAERQRNPDPTLGLQGGASSEGGTNQVLLNLTLNVPMYIRNNYQAELDAAKFDAMRASEQYAQSLNQVSAKIKTSAERYQMLYENMQNWYHVSNQPLTKGMELIERLWSVGEITTMDYLLQLRIRIDSQIAGVELKGKEWHAWIEWLQSSGQVFAWLARTA